MTKFPNMGTGLFLSALLLCGTAPDRAESQPAPVSRAVVPADTAPEAMSGLYDELSDGERVIGIEGAQWLQLQLTDFDLGSGGTLTISGDDGQSQTFTQEQLEAWEGLTGIFNGSRLTVTLDPGPAEPATASIENIIIGLPTAEGPARAEAAPQPLQELFGSSLGQFIPEDAPRPPEPAPSREIAPEAGEGTQESICGAADNRSASSHPFSGRIMPIGCTGWIIEGGAILTAGHCITSATQTLEFNVPSSQSNGTTVSPPISDQYKIISGSIVSGYTGVGNDWAVFEVLPNTQTGLKPLAAQGGGFKPSNTASPSSVVITGYGVDGPAPGFGNPPPRNADNQTQQTHSGSVTQHVVNGPSNAVIRYTVDTQGGNSGSPVYAAGNVAVGIHTNGGCGASGGANAGTSFRNDALWNALPAVPVPGSAAVTGWLKLLLGN